MAGSGKGFTEHLHLVVGVYGLIRGEVYPGRAGMGPRGRRHSPQRQGSWRDHQWQVRPASPSFTWFLLWPFLLNFHKRVAADGMPLFRAAMSSFGQDVDDGALCEQLCSEFARVQDELRKSGY